jgi:hypothetical protein
VQHDTDTNGFAGIASKSFPGHDANAAEERKLSCYHCLVGAVVPMLLTDPTEVASAGLLLFTAGAGPFDSLFSMSLRGVSTWQSTFCAVWECSL